MEKVRNVFRALDRSWLIRHYLFSFVFLAIFSYSSRYDDSYFSSGFILFLLSSIFYPFAMFVYESIVKLIMGDNVFILPAIPLLIWKLVRFIIIWAFSIPIGIIGFGYLYFRINKGS
ncbi:hypothetical protein [Streptococcus gallolyticus]|uniref:hypothetical protein n=1 Tax=Streptococcus gallolyticus TaxID=315405 RepID=UPI00087FFE43|nr:hypothetical protein [Streptococcus gallolyticus]SDJ83634.1 hypothetical protein SAMN04487842_0819 [Streptococcus gallolyticus]SDL33633.1 hypothetical protein SAMN04487841_0822 [Streptococcus gallolyticus]